MSYRLTYFDFDGGRGEPLRIAMAAADIPFEDHRISFEEFVAERSAWPFRCVPVLTLDEKPITQTNALLRFIGKKAALYPADELQALYCDETMGVVEDIIHKIVVSFGLEGAELKSAREALVDDWLSVFLKGLAELLQRGGGQYFADNRLTVADLKVFVQIRSLRSGNLDHVPPDLVDTLAPTLVQHLQRVADDPIVAGYYAKRNEAR